MDDSKPLAKYSFAWQYYTVLFPNRIEVTRKLFLFGLTLNKDVIPLSKVTSVSLNGTSMRATFLTIRMNDGTVCKPKLSYWKAKDLHAKILELL